MTNYEVARSRNEAKGFLNIRYSELFVVLAVIVALSLASYARNMKWFDTYGMWTDVLEKSESKWRPHYRMGLILYQGGRYGQALSRLSHAYELKPDARGILNNIGLAYQRLGRLDRASASYLRSIERGDSVALANLNLGTIYLRRGDLTGALAFFKRSLEADPQNAVALVNTGFTHADMGNYAEAIKLHARAVELDPYYANAHYGLAIAQEGSGNLKEALVEWERYLKLAPKVGRWSDLARSNIERLARTIDRVDN